jgi:flagellar basal-body rod modification protein FlgD
MALDSVPTVSTTNHQAAQISQQDFLRILLTQLTAQDPLKPVDNTAFVAQLAQFSQLEQTQELSTNLKQLLSVQTATQSVGLLGRTVQINNGLGTVTGQITDISVSGTSPVVTVHPSTGSDVTGVSLNQIIDIK